MGIPYGRIFALFTILIIYAILAPIIKEIDKRNAEDRLAKKIAKEQEKLKEKQK